MRGVRYFILLAFLHSPAGAVDKDAPSSGTGNNGINRIFTSASEQLKTLMVGGLASLQTANDAVTDKVRSYGGTAGKMLDNFPVTGTPAEQMESLVAAFVAEMSNQFPDSVSIQDTEETLNNGVYVCGSNGALYNLKSISVVDWMFETLDDYNELHLKFKFGDFHIYFQNFVISAEYMFSVILRGNLDMEFKENEMEIVLKVPKFSNIASELRNKCMVYLKDFKVHKLGSPHVVFNCESRLQSTVQEKINDIFSKPEELVSIRETMTKTVSTQLNKRVTQSNSWVCLDQNLKNSVALRYNGLNVLTTISKSFNYYCAENWKTWLDR